MDICLSRHRPDCRLLRRPVRRLRAHHGAAAPPPEHLHHAAHRQDDRGGQWLSPGGEVPPRSRLGKRKQTSSTSPSPPSSVGLQVSHSACVMTTAVICKLLRSKEATATVDIRNWPPVLDTGTEPRPPAPPTLSHFRLSGPVLLTNALTMKVMQTHGRFSTTTCVFSCYLFVSSTLRVSDA